MVSASLRDIGMQIVEIHIVMPCKQHNVLLNYRQPAKQHLMRMSPQHFSTYSVV